MYPSQKFSNFRVPSYNWAFNFKTLSINKQCLVLLFYLNLDIFGYSFQVHFDYLAPYVSTYLKIPVLSNTFIDICRIQGFVIFWLMLKCLNQVPLVISLYFIHCFSPFEWFYTSYFWSPL